MRNLYDVALFVLLVGRIGVGVAAGEGEGSAGASTIEKSERLLFHVPSFSVSELDDGSRSDEVAAILAGTGLISVSGNYADVAHLVSLREEAFTGMCNCMKKESSSSSPFAFVQGADSSMLEDGTTRTTLATATVGETPLKLNSDQLLQAGCSAETVQAMDSIRDQVAWISHVFISALDRLLIANDNSREVLLDTIHDNSYSTVKSIVKASQHLEHFHVYDKASGNAGVLDVHTDAGLFLSFVPGRSCSSDESSDFFVQHQGILKQAVFEPGTVGLMLGVGAEHWLQTSVPLRATRHAVSMQSGQSRAWYGMMHLVPQDAIVQDFPKRTFADMRKSMVLNSKKARDYKDNNADDVDVDDIAIGCGSSSALSQNNGSTRISRRRVGTADDASFCNNATNFFCWSSCLDIPNVEQAAQKIVDGHSLYCAAPSTLVSSGVAAAVQDCTGSGGVAGGNHNEACVGIWQPTVDGVPSQEVVVEKQAVQDAKQELEDQFCFGGTSMYMDGFHWTNPTCVIYLFPKWALSTAGLLTAACIGTIFFGMALEGVIKQRRTIVNKAPAGWRRVGISAAFYGVQLTMGYMLMLVVMTYSGPLFMCVVLGLMGGHIIFNADSGVEKKKSSDDATRSRESDEVEFGREEVVGCCGNRTNGDDNDECDCGIPEGSTPCCQHSL